MGDFGLKLSKPFSDANTAADSDLIFNSAWPSLPVAKVLTTTSNPAVFVDHDLDFVPFSVMYVEQTDGSYARDYPYANTSQIYTECSNSIPATNYAPANATTYVVCYNIDIAAEQEYPVLNPSGPNTEYDPNFGIKISKEDASINSTDLRDYVLHSRCQSPLVLANITQDNTQYVTRSNDGTYDNTTITYTNPYDYPAWVFGYIKIGYSLLVPETVGFYRGVPYDAQAYPQIFTDGITSTLTARNDNTNVKDTDLSVLSLRDPMFSPTTVEVTY